MHYAHTYIYITFFQFRTNKNTLILLGTILLIACFLHLCMYLLSDVPTTDVVTRHWLTCIVKPQPPKVAATTTHTHIHTRTQTDTHTHTYTHTNRHSYTLIHVKCIKHMYAYTHSHACTHIHTTVQGLVFLAIQNALHQLVRLHLLREGAKQYPTRNSSLYS